MVPGQIAFPPDWLQSGTGALRRDLDLVVLLVNSYDLLDDPPDRLHDLGWFAGALRAVGHRWLADALADPTYPRCAGCATGCAGLRGPRPGCGGRGPEPAADPQPRRPVARAGRPGRRVARGRPGPVRDQRAGGAAAGCARGLRRSERCRAARDLRRRPVHLRLRRPTRGGTRRFCCSICNDRTAARILSSEAATGRMTHAGSSEDHQTVRRRGERWLPGGGLDRNVRWRSAVMPATVTRRGREVKLVVQTSWPRANASVPSGDGSHSSGASRPARL